MHVYLGLFLVAFSSLSLEITLVRLLSVTTWYHLAFFAISTAMLGMTAGATRVYLNPRAFDRDVVGRSVSSACIHFALIIPVSLVLLCLVPLGQYRTVMTFFSLLITTVACGLPFLFAGTIVSAVLTKQSLPIGKLYASDLIGASLGCLFVLGGLQLFDPSSVILLCSSVVSFAAICFAWRESSAWHRHVAVALSILFLVVAVTNSFTTRGIRPMIVKARKVEPAYLYQQERNNSFSRIAVYKLSKKEPQYWGPSPLAPREPIEQYEMNIDGEAGTVMRKFAKKEDIDHLRYDVTNMAYYLGRGGNACIIGVGGGRDVLSALLFGFKHIDGIEINPIFIDLLRRDFRTFAGIADRPEVNLITAEARSYLSRSQKKYSLIQMSLIDTWAATGAGALSLAENSLYTVEAWDIFLKRLTDDGIFTVSRWYSPQNIGETGRLVSLAVGALMQLGVQNPSKHVAVIVADRIATLLVCREPLSSADISKLERIAKDLSFGTVCLPGTPPENRLLRDIVSVRTQDQLTKAVADAEFNCNPPTDESPYFFNMLRLTNIGAAFSVGGGVVSGNLMATLTLIGLMLTLLMVATGTIILPLMARKYLGTRAELPSHTVWAGALYFSLIGCGFMLTEIALIQRMTVLLTHPIYALGILLFTLIASTGVGSLLSDQLPLTRSPWLYVYPIVTAMALIGLNMLLKVLLPTMVTTSLMVKIVTSIAVIFPVGLLMGLFFPTGMRLAKEVSSAETPWYWALNGIFGVLCSAIAVLISIYHGISTNFYVAAACYVGVVVAQVGLRRAKVTCSSPNLK